MEGDGSISVITTDNGAQQRVQPDRKF
jgi:hypothetical protein